MTELSLSLSLLLAFPSNCPSNLDLKFSYYRQLTLSKLCLHLEKDPGCILEDLIPVITEAPFKFESAPYEVRAWCFPENNDPSMYFNFRFKWDEEKAERAVIHEAFHLAGICGPDTNRSEVPVCTLFGKPLYVSSDISKAIKEHLKGEL